jgi:hypothetical protein
MTKEGYTHIIVPKELHTILKQEAEAREMSIATYIASELYRLRTIESVVSGGAGINTTAQDTVKPKKKGNSSELENTLCADRDLDPGYRLGKPM